ncbi:hypothetical protein [Geodermatophilus normandii]|uniref:Uncharacterized protein n=1 Tax=Geodermatophilus normandii TaxID=1137989 RepID=A0A6P0GP46_9ACTN|nr:hypothetical protein [Geodermatophilus normandii]NEM08732.1 hypothetical protein [Geodermatophilus normandii]
METKYGLLTIHLIELDQGWVAKVDSRYDNEPVHEATGGSMARSADLALNRLWLAIERS